MPSNKNREKSVTNFQMKMERKMGNNRYFPHFLHFHLEASLTFNCYLSDKFPDSEGYSSFILIRVYTKLFQIESTTI